MICAMAFSIYGQQPNELINRDFWRSNPSLKEVKQKVKEGHSPKEFTSSMFDALGYAILENQPQKTLKYLLSVGNDINVLTHDARTYLHWAAYKGNLEFMEYLVAQGARTDILDQGGYSVMMFSAVTGQQNKEVYEFCERYGMMISTDKDRSGRNAILASASRLENFELLDYFIEKGADIHTKDKDGNGVFHFAALGGNMEILQSLIEKYDVDYSVNETTSQNAFHFASRRFVREGDPSPMPLYEFLESLGLDPALNSKDNQNVLHHLAYRTNDLEMIDYFVDKGANPALVDVEGNTPLINASSRGSKEKVAYFLRFSHDVNHQNKEGYSAMTRAFKYNTMEVVELLDKHNAKTDIVDAQGFDFGYHLVDVTRSNFETFDQKMAFLKSKGYNPLSLQKDKSTLLHAAINKKNQDLIQKLLDLGLDINATDDSGQTILHHAAMQAENEALLKYLLAAGADKTKRTEFEESAYDLAMENEILKNSEINIDFLKPNTND